MSNPPFMYNNNMQNSQRPPNTNQFGISPQVSLNQSVPQNPMMQPVYQPPQQFPFSPFPTNINPPPQTNINTFQMQSQLISMKSNLDEKNEEIEELKKKLTQTEKEAERQKQKASEINSKFIDQTKTISKLREEQGEINMKNFQLESEKGVLSQKLESLTHIMKQSKTSEIQDSLNLLVKKNEQLVKENIDLKSSVFQFGGSQLNDEIQQLQNKIKKQEKETKKYQDINNLMESKISDLESKITARDQSISYLQTQTQQFEKKTKQLQKEISRIQEESKINQIMSEQKSKIIESIQKNGVNIGYIKQFEDQMNQQILSIQIQSDSMKQSYKDSKILQKQMKEKEQQSQAQEKVRKQKQAKEIMKKFQESYGMIDICYLIDTTGSMEPYKQQAEESVTGSIESVKKLTQRDTRWATICYKDYDELKQLNGYYEQMDFTTNSKQLKDFINQVRCNGGGDGAEDVEGGIKQALRDLTWQSNFKVMIHICDYPSHGAKFYDTKLLINDDYPKNDMTQIIELMVEKNIFFVGLVFTPKTIKMFEEIRNIYRAKNKEDYVYIQDLSKVTPTKLFQDIVGIVSKISCTLTQCNQKQTRFSVQNQTGMQALPSQKQSTGNFQPLDSKKTITIDSVVEQLSKMNVSSMNMIEEQFKIFTIRVNDESFLRKCKKIEEFNVNDFIVEQEAVWSCQRTIAPFAEGAVKAAFLMVKQKKTANKDELYVCKIPKNLQPYKTKEEVLKDCMYHILCQKFLRQFWEDIEQAQANKGITNRYPRLDYSDILLLQDRNGTYWMAERFFKGDFVKYNNNFGYVEQSKSEMNSLAQSFSYYTYYKSEFSHLVCDIQGVGVNLTDPAICTAKNFRIEKTDAGEEGIGNYLISFKGIKSICQPIFDLLGIDAEV